MPSDDAAISVRDLTKTYRLFSHPGDRIKQFFSFGIKRYHRQFTALQDISFDIKKGETVGIIGRNGSGKSTLLQLICGILRPTSGTVQRSGRISALLELGAGFSPEFTGRENVYFQGALMGFTKADMDARFDDIVAFADIGEFIDQPVRTYSSGMFVRLAFAAMIHADADVLVIDEALSVGDEAFQQKCFDKLQAYLEGNEKILLFVSHNVRQVERICSRAIWLEDGRVVQQGPPTETCAAYQANIYQQVQGLHESNKPLPTFADSGEVEVIRLQLFNDAGLEPIEEIEIHSALRIAVDFRCHSHLIEPDIIVGFHTIDSVFVATASTAVLPTQPDFPIGEHRVEVRVADLLLLPGVYQVRLGFLDRHFRPMWAGHRLNTFRVLAPADSKLVRLPPSLVDMPFEWRFSSSAILGQK
jgi:ABC-type polysaccharide/polyol phosphate transport system ATPase subunit